MSAFGQRRRVNAARPLCIALVMAFGGATAAAQGLDAPPNILDPSLFRKDLDKYCSLQCERARLNKSAADRSADQLNRDIDQQFKDAYTAQDGYREARDSITARAGSALQTTRGVVWLTSKTVDAAFSAIEPDGGTGKGVSVFVQALVQKGVERLEEYYVEQTTTYYEREMAKIRSDDQEFVGKTDAQKIAILAGRLKGSVDEKFEGMDPALVALKKEELERNQYAFNEAQIKLILGTKRTVEEIDKDLGKLVQDEKDRWEDTKKFQARAEAYFQASSSALNELQSSMSRLEQRQGGVESFLYSQMSIPERLDALENRGWLPELEGAQRQQRIADLKRAEVYANYASYVSNGVGALGGLQVLLGGNDETIARAMELGQQTSASLDVVANFLANPSPLSALQSIGSLGGIFGRKRAADPMARVMKQLRDLDRKLDRVLQGLDNLQQIMREQALRAESNHLELVGLLQQLKDQVTTIESKVSAVVALQGMQYCEGYVRALQRSGNESPRPQLWTEVQLINFASAAGDDTSRCITYLRQTVPLQDESPFAGNVFTGTFRDEAPDAYALQSMSHAYMEEAFRDLARYGTDSSALDTRRRYLYLVAIDPSQSMKSLRRSHVALSGDATALKDEVALACAGMTKDDVQAGGFRRDVARFACSRADRLLPAVRLEDALKERFNTRLVVRYAALSQDMSFWAEALQSREDGTFEPRLRFTGGGDITDQAKALRLGLLRDALDRVELTAAQDRFFSSGAGVMWIYDRLTALAQKPSTDEGAREERRLLELFLQSRPALATNLVHYIVERELSTASGQTIHRKRLEQSYAVLHRTSVADYIDLGFDVRTADDADKLREPHRSCVADSSVCQAIQGPFDWLSKAWRLRYNALPATEAQGLPLEAGVSADSKSKSCETLPSESLRKRLGVDVSGLLQRQCSLREFNPECESERKPSDPSAPDAANRVRVCVPSGWSIQFGGSAFPLPTPRRLALGAPVELDRAGYLGLARQGLIDSIAETRLLEEIEGELRSASERRRGFSRDPQREEALKSLHILQARWMSELAANRP